MPEERLTLTEASTSLGDLQQEPAKGHRYRALLIKAGWGASGYYGEEVLRRDGPKIWPAGTHSYLNHPTLTEQIDQPERAVEDLASVIVTDPVWDSAEDGLVAVVEVFPQWTTLLNERFAKQIGLSIRAYGTAEHGEAEGREGPIITSLDEGISVDWVTRAGAGGKVLELIESARSTGPVGEPKRLAEGRNIGHFIESKIHTHFTGLADGMFGEGRLTRPERIGLSNAIGDGLKSFTSRVETDHPQLYERDLWADPADGAEMSEASRSRLREGHGMTANDLSSALADAVRETYGGDRIYTWVRDYTDDWVVFSVEDSSDCDLYQQDYAVDGDTQAVTLTGEPVEVLARTTYAPAPPDPDEPEEPAEPAEGPLKESDPQNAPGSTPADNQKEGAMPELTESEVRALTEARDKAQTDAATALAEADQARKNQAASDLQLARFRAAESARPIASTALAESDLPVPAQVRILGTVTADNVPLTSSSALDEAALRVRISDAIKAEATYLASLAEGTGQGKPRDLGEATAGTGTGTAADAAASKNALIEAYKAKGMSPAAAELAATGRPF